MNRLINFGLWSIIFAAIGFLLAGYLGALHPAFDSVGVFRIYALGTVLMALAMVLVLRRWRMAMASGVALLMGGVTMVPYGNAPMVQQGGLRVMQSNLVWYNSARELGPYARQTSPDIITLQEVTHRSQPSLQTMRKDYPHQIFCGFASVGGVAILSKYPALSSGCKQGEGMAWLRVETPEGSFTIVALHLHWPWPHGQAEQVDKLIPQLESLPRPIIVAGDFNMVPWSHTVQRIEAATDTQIISGIRHSLNLYGGVVRLPIDHVLVPKGMAGTAAIGPQLGSDHHSILAKIEFE